jgi:hypothetical protein
MLSLVQRVFWNPLTREENRRLPEIRASELVAAAALVIPMVWIGVRPNDFLDRLRPSVEEVRRSVAARKAAASSSLSPRASSSLSPRASSSLSPRASSSLSPRASSSLLSSRAKREISLRKARGSSALRAPAGQGKGASE